MNLRETQQTSKLNIKGGKGTQTLLEPLTGVLTGVLPSKDSEIRGAIVRMANTNAIHKRQSINSSQLKTYLKNQPNDYGKEKNVKARSSCN